MPSSPGMFSPAAPVGRAARQDSSASRPSLPRSRGSQALDDAPRRLAAPPCCNRPPAGPFAHPPPSPTQHAIDVERVSSGSSWRCTRARSRAIAHRDVGRVGAKRRRAASSPPHLVHLEGIQLAVCSTPRYRARFPRAAAGRAACAVTARHDAPRRFRLPAPSGLERDACDGCGPSTSRTTAPARAALAGDGHSQIDILLALRAAETGNPACGGAGFAVACPWRSFLRP